MKPDWRRPFPAVMPATWVPCPFRSSLGAGRGVDLGLGAGLGAAAGRHARDVPDRPDPRRSARGLEVGPGVVDPGVDDADDDARARPRPRETRPGLDRVGLRGSPRDVELRERVVARLDRGDLAAVGERLERRHRDDPDQDVARLHPKRPAEGGEVGLRLLQVGRLHEDGRQDLAARTDLGPDQRLRLVRRKRPGEGSLALVVADETLEGGVDLLADRPRDRDGGSGRHPALSGAGGIRGRTDESRRGHPRQGLQEPSAEVVERHRMSPLQRCGAHA